jgi:hypothetical protein
MEMGVNHMRHRWQADFTQGEENLAGVARAVAGINQNRLRGCGDDADARLDTGGVWVVGVYPDVIVELVEFVGHKRLRRLLYRYQISFVT